MAKKLSQTPASSCAFTSSDGRQCRMPRNSSKEKFCYNHQRKHLFQKQMDENADLLCESISDTQISASGIAISLSRLYFAAAQGRISPRAANALSRVAATMLRAVPLANTEFTCAVGERVWRNNIRELHGYEPYHPRPTEPPPAVRPAQESSSNSAGNTTGK